MAVTEGLGIVVVEDDALIAMDLADLLIAMGHDVLAIVQNESEAVAAAMRCQPDLMIVDGQLAEGSGTEAMRKILANGFVAHFYITGDPLRITGLAPDAVVVAKPFTLHDLASGIARARRSRGGVSPEA
jgi:DNA-binding response OmpR family regulator